MNKDKIITTNTGAKIGNMYPPDLKKLILSFLETQELRPKAEDAFNEALYIYTIKYLQVTSIMALFFCFFSVFTPLIAHFSFAFSCMCGYRKLLLLSCTFVFFPQ